MAKKRPRARRSTEPKSNPAKTESLPLSDEELQRPPGSEGAGLTGGDLDADWRRAPTVGEEAVGGSVATPDQDVVDGLGDALGVPRAPDEEVRTSGEIMEERDRRRWEQER